MYKSGQIIKARVKKFPLIIHYGIVLVDDGNTFVVHNTPVRSSVIDRLDDWLSSRTLINVTGSGLMCLSNEEIAQRFKDTCAGQYDVFNYNCEHFVDCMLQQPERSEQVAKWLMGAAFFGFLYKIGVLD